MTQLNLPTWPDFSSEEIETVSQILTSSKVNYWTGNEGKTFEKEFSSWTGANYSIALANGTLALELALKSLNLLPDDEVIVSPRTFIASVSSVINIGSTPVFADVDPESGNITASSIEKVRTKKTKAIVCVHLAGWPCDMDSIMQLAKKNNIYVIEDCSQAHGACYDGKSVGSLGDIGTWSFCQDKIMSTGGEGGMVTTNDERIWRSMWEYKDHGKSYDKVSQTNLNPGFRWLHDSFGSNYRMTEMQSAIGRIQLTKMKSWTQSRNRNASFLLEVCNRLPNILRTPIVPSIDLHAYYKFYTYIKPEGLKQGYSRDIILENLNHLGVPAFSGSCSEIYLESAFDKTSFRPNTRLPIAKQLGETSIVFLVHPTLSDGDMSAMSNIIEKVFEDASL
ncbi:DegT/DnrJ/EryC1/StrS aminotransferase family protein [Gammaproteobacteria bacterium]|nr:DegT/DnrJ/EryC1/StrS aminotransferase family protein [Gammaproteobacteria bacterium]